MMLNVIKRNPLATTPYRENDESLGLTVCSFIHTHVDPGQTTQLPLGLSFDCALRGHIIGHPHALSLGLLVSGVVPPNTPDVMTWIILKNVSLKTAFIHPSQPIGTLIYEHPITVAGSTLLVHNKYISDYLPPSQ
jgi:hypothetical protein